jgi:DNA polymerase-3 subunit epsilon
MREIVLDTETTGLDPKAGHRIVEIGCVEVVNHVATGRTFHCYVNPERPMDPEAEAVHGLGDTFLADKPVFASVVEEFLGFIADAPLVIHNAPFDMAFLNAELARLKLKVLPKDRAVDTVQLARRRFPGAQVNLDALCRRYGIDNSSRDLHGALLDAQLLAEVYLELRGGRQPGLTLAADAGITADAATPRQRARREPRHHAPTADEATAHDALLAKLKDPIWARG